MKIENIAMEEHVPATEPRLLPRYLRTARRVIISAAIITLLMCFFDYPVHVGGIRFYLTMFLAGIVGSLIGNLPDLVFPYDVIEAERKYPRKPAKGLSALFR